MFVFLLVFIPIKILGILVVIAVNYSYSVFVCF